MERYVSEMREIGKDANPKRPASQLKNSAPKFNVLSKAHKQKSSLMTVFPSYGIQGANNPFQTTNQIYEFKKEGDFDELKLGTLGKITFLQLFIVYHLLSLIRKC